MIIDSLRAMFWPQTMLQRATSAILREEYFDLPAGTRVALTWNASYLSAPRNEGGRLVHQFVAYGYDLLGCYTMIFVTDTDIRDISFTPREKVDIPI